MPDVMQNLVKNVIKIKYTDLPGEAIDFAKKSVLDTIAVTIAGSTSDGCKQVVDLVKEWGGREEATIWVYGGKVPTPLAGLAIGPMSRALDFGDVYEKGFQHITEFILPAALPVAEHRGGINGKDFITALALGQDLAARLYWSLSPNPSGAAHEMIVVFGPTATVAKLLQLDEDTMMNAMGIAYMQAAGELQAFKDGALTVRLHHGFMADAAIKAVLLAQRGITGSKNILEGEYGIYKVVQPIHNLEVVTPGLGERFEGANTSIKPYPCCKLSHGAISVTIDLVKEHDIKPQDVDYIGVGVGPFAYSFLCEPHEVKSNPRNPVDCQFSLAYHVAVAMVKRSLFIDDFTQEVLGRTDIQDTMKKVEVRVEDEVVKPDNLLGGAVVSIKTKDGKEYSKKLYYVKGHPKNPMSMDEVIEKFRKCLPFSAKKLPERNVEQIIEMVGELEKVDDVSKIARLLSV
ncbi:MmgE/PrpD family protein [Chloroflexota bacterium]